MSAAPNPDVHGPGPHAILPYYTTVTLARATKLGSIGANFLPVRPGRLEGDADGEMIAAILAVNDKARSVPPAAGPERREEQRQGLVRTKRVLRYRPHAAARHVQHVKADDATRVVLRGIVADGLERHADDGTPKPSPILRSCRCVAHGSTPHFSACAARTGVETSSTADQTLPFATRMRRLGLYLLPLGLQEFSHTNKCDGLPHKHRARQAGFADRSRVRLRLCR